MFGANIDCFFFLRCYVVSIDVFMFGANMKGLSYVQLICSRKNLVYKIFQKWFEQTTSNRPEQNFSKEKFSDHHSFEVFKGPLRSFVFKVAMI